MTLRGQLEHLLDADRHLGGLRAGVAQAALAEQAVHALGDDRRLGGDLVLAGAHADDPAGLVLQELLDGDAADVLGAGVLGLGGEPLVEGRAQDRVGVLALLGELGAREVDRHLRGRVHERDALVGDLALERRLGLEVGEHLLQRVRVDAPAGHVLRAGEVAALDHEGRLAGLRELVGRHGARAPGAHDDRVEISHVLSFPIVAFPFSCRPANRRAPNEHDPGSEHPAVAFPQPCRTRRLSRTVEAAVPSARGGRGASRPRRAGEGLVGRRREDASAPLPPAALGTAA